MRRETRIGHGTAAGQTAQCETSFGYESKEMNRDEILKAAQRELERHTLSTFNESAPTSSMGFVVATGCPACRIRFGTIDQLVRHLSVDVLPGIVDLAIGGGREPGMDDEELPI